MRWLLLFAVLVSGCTSIHYSTKNPVDCQPIKVEVFKGEPVFGDIVQTSIKKYLPSDDESKLIMRGSVYCDVWTGTILYFKLSENGTEKVAGYVYSDFIPDIAAKHLAKDLRKKFFKNCKDFR